MNALGTAMIWCAIQVTLFALVAGIVYLLAGRRDATSGARTALFSLLGVALLTAIFWSPWPNWSNAAERWFGSEAPHVEDAAGAVEQPTPSSETIASAESVSADRESSASPAPAAWSELLRSMWNGLGRTPDISTATGQVASRWTWRTVAALVFVAITMFGLARLIGGLVGVGWLRRQSFPLHDAKLRETLDVVRAELGCKLNVAVSENPRLITAATVGWRRPLVLLPTTWRSWTPIELRAVLAHEIAHVRRGDFATHLLGQVAVALHFYHPLVHWLAGRLRLEQELAADAAAARIAGGQQSYLTTLAQLALAQPSARLAWPVHGFLPTRRTFLRRIEMLRDRKTVAATSGASSVHHCALGWFAIALLCIAGLAAAGLRAPRIAYAQDTTADPTQETGSAVVPNEDSPYNFSYVPDNFMALAAVRPAAIAADARLRPLAKLLEQTARPRIPAESMEQAMLVVIPLEISNQGTVEAGSDGSLAVIHTTKPIDFASYLRKGYPSLTTEQHQGHELFVTSSNPYLTPTMFYYAPNDTTLVGRVRAGLLKLLADKDASKAPVGAKQWQEEAKGPLVVIARGYAFASALRQLPGHGDAGLFFQPIAPLVENGDTLLVTADVGEQLTLDGRITCRSPEGATAVADTLEALAVLAKNLINTQRRQLIQAKLIEPSHMAMLDFGQTCLDGRQITTEGSEVRLNISLGDTDTAVRLFVDVLAPAVEASREATRREMSLNNLKQIALAMHVYHDANKHFPPAVLYGPDGKTPYSWRVALLKHLDPDLYIQYRFDEPWDSPANRKVLEQMPDIYRHPTDDSGSTNTSYFVLTGPDTAFGSKEGTKIRDIVDGTAKTILTVEAKRDVPWTKPEDIPYAADQPLPKFGGWFENIFLAVLCDGSAQVVSQQIDEKMLRAMITKAGREVIQGNEVIKLPQ